MLTMNPQPSKDYIVNNEGKRLLYYQVATINYNFIYYNWEH